MAPCAMHRLPSKTPSTKPTPSSHRNDLGRERIVSLALRDKIPECCQRRVPRLLSNRTLQGFNQVLFSNITPISFLTYKQMAQPTPARLLLWAIRCDLAVFPSESRPRRRIPSHPTHSSSVHRHHLFHQNRAHHNLICRTCHRAITPTLLHPHQVLGPQRTRMACLVGR